MSTSASGPDHEESDEQDPHGQDPAQRDPYQPSPYQQGPPSPYQQPDAYQQPPYQQGPPSPYQQPDAYQQSTPGQAPYPQAPYGPGGYARSGYDQGGYDQGPYGRPYVPQKSRVVAGVLGILLGSLGVHRFYLGFTTIGIIQLLLATVGAAFTFGLSAVAAGIWGLVEGIMILVGSEQFSRDARGIPLKD